MEINEKYEALYKEALSKTAPEIEEDCCYSEDENGNYVPATPIGYDKEQLEFDALNTVLLTAFTKDKDYVCWSDGGYTKKSKDILETLEGTIMKAYDPVLLLGNFGEPLAFMMFTGEMEEEGDYKKVVFLYMREDKPTKYKKKVFVPNNTIKKLNTIKAKPLGLGKNKV